MSCCLEASDSEKTGRDLTLQSSVVLFFFFAFLSFSKPSMPSLVVGCCSYKSCFTDRSAGRKLIRSRASSLSSAEV